ncbi:hypothetical protein THTE_3360 [Thermogutta terrifontis]|uniref:Uncharacterized protein n=1 Tax=Thermogutta terrifontis TaxID=1331910 RepID=A0A286RJ70_9BACT|nr:hypothetical protein THTE_3360 [Thermogutta terrifontis]
MQEALSPSFVNLKKLIDFESFCCSSEMVNDLDAFERWD